MEGAVWMLKGGGTGVESKRLRAEGGGSSVECKDWRAGSGA